MLWLSMNYARMGNEPRGRGGVTFASAVALSALLLSSARGAFAADCSLLRASTNASAVDEILAAETQFLAANDTAVSLVENCQRKNSTGHTVQATLTVVTAQGKQLQANFACVKTTGGGELLTVRQFGHPSLVAEQRVCVACTDTVTPCQVCSLACLHGGTQRSDCSQCRCPAGYRGQLCDQVAATVAPTIPSSRTTTPAAPVQVENATLAAAVAVETSAASKLTPTAGAVAITTAASNVTTGIKVSTVGSVVSTSEVSPTIGNSSLTAWEGYVTTTTGNSSLTAWEGYVTTDAPTTGQSTAVASQNVTSFGIQPDVPATVTSSSANVTSSGVAHDMTTQPAPLSQSPAMSNVVTSNSSIATQPPTPPLHTANATGTPSQASTDNGSLANSAAMRSSQASTSYPATPLSPSIGNLATMPPTPASPDTGNQTNITVTTSPRASASQPVAPALPCQPSPCRNNGTCLATGGVHLCVCPDTHHGDACQDLTPSCRCTVDGVCTDEHSGEACACPVGMTGMRCDERMSPCASQPCSANATCVSTVDARYACRCPLGYAGDQCAVNVDDCAGNLCENNSTCVDGLGEYECRCEQRYEGMFCERERFHCSPDVCQNGAACHELHGDVRCLCLWGYSGQFCQQRLLDHCASRPCDSTAQCRNEADGFACECVPGTSGKRCNVTRCSSRPCANNGLCQLDRHANYRCVCRRGWSGRNCTDPDLAVCTVHGCTANMKCNRRLDMCKCERGFTGTNCTQAVVADCTAHGCPGNRLCNTTTGECHCRPGYVGVGCYDDVDECLAAPCNNSGMCVNTKGGFACRCVNGYEGHRCDECQNECAHNHLKCGANGRCDRIHCPRYSNLRLSGTVVTDNQPSGSRCVCQDGYHGEFCQYHLASCNGKPCHNGGQCEDVANGESRSVTCHCGGNWSGTTCQDCNLQCIHGNVDEHCRRCTCKQGWSGAKCDECDGVIQGQDCISACTIAGYEATSIEETPVSVCFACGIHSCVECNRPPFTNTGSGSDGEHGDPGAGVTRVRSHGNGNSICTKCDSGSLLIKGRCLDAQGAAIRHQLVDTSIVIAVVVSILLLICVLIIVVVCIVRRRHRKTYTAKSVPDSSFVVNNCSATQEEIELQTITAAPKASNGHGKGYLLEQLSAEFPSLRMVVVAHAVQSANLDAGKARELLQQEVQREDEERRQSPVFADTDRSNPAGQASSGEPSGRSLSATASGPVSTVVPVLANSSSR